MKKLFLIVLLILLAASLTKAQVNNYKIYAIKFAESGVHFSTADWAAGAPKSDSVKIDFMIWLIKGSNGKNILVDAGFLNDLDDAKEFKVTHYIRPDSALLKFGINPADITDIVFTHPHWDHIDGVSLFPNAHIWIQKEDFNYFVTTAWQKNEHNGGFEKRDVRSLIDLNMAGEVTLIKGDNKEIIPGIKVFTGSRHTFNSQYVLVQSGNDKTILASDNIWVYYSLDHLVPPAEGGTLDPQGYVKAMVRMKTMVSNVKYIIPGHDDRIFACFPKLAEGIAEIR